MISSTEPQHIRPIVEYGPWTHEAEVEAKTHEADAEADRFFGPRGRGQDSRLNIPAYSLQFIHLYFDILTI